MMIKKNQKNPTKTVLIITVGFIIVFLLSKWPWAIYVALIVGVFGSFSDFASAKIDWAWMKLTSLLSYFIPNILLTIVFYLFLTPIALISHLFTKKDQLHLKNNEESLFNSNNKIYDHESFHKTW